MRAAFLVPALGLLFVTAPAVADLRNTNIVVTSDIDPLPDEPREKKKRFGLDLGPEATLGFNEDGDPAVFRFF